VKAWRVVWKTPAILVATGIIVSVPLIASVVLAPWPRALARVRARATRWWGRSLCAILGVTRAVEGGEPPYAGGMVAANHLSYLDILVLASLYPCLFVAKGDIASWPLLGWVARASGTVFIHRGLARDLVRASQVMTDHLKNGLSITIFPEGSTSAGSKVRPFLPSLLQPAAEGGIPCWAASLTYEIPGDVIAPSVAVCWHDGSSLPVHLRRLMGLASIVARVRFAGTPVMSRDRKELARFLWSSVATNFEPVR